MMATIAELREKYDLHMRVERFVTDTAGVSSQDAAFIRAKEACRLRSEKSAAGSQLLSAEETCMPIYAIRGRETALIA